MATAGSTNRNSQTTRMPLGVTNAAQWQTMSNAGLLDPTWAHTYANDFDQYVSADWTLSGTGTPAAALAAGDGGILNLTTTTGASDSAFLIKNPTAFKVSTANKQTFFKFAGTVSRTDGAFYCGLTSTAVAEASIVNGIVLYKAAAGTTFVLDVIAASTHTSVALPASCVIAASTYIELGIAVDSLGNVAAFWNPTTGNNQINGGVVGSTAPRGAVALLQVPTLPTVTLAPIVSYTNGSANAVTVGVDYLVASTER